MTDNDPRVEAAMDVLAALAPDGDSPPRFAVAEALQAADAVDPVRCEDFAALVALCERIVARHYPHDVFTAEYSGPHDRGARFVAALRAPLRDLDPEPPLHREGS